MKKVLILTAGFGEGHNAASRNLRDALEYLSDEVKVEILDLFESSYGALNTIAKKSCLSVVQYAPSVWGKIYSILDSSSIVEKNLGGFTRLRNALGDILHEAQPDCVVSTYPVYSHVVQELFRDHKERSFRFITVITDSITINSTWYRAPSDWFCVPNKATADVLRRAGVASGQIRALGFPVSRLFNEPPKTVLAAPKSGELKRILYLINTGKKKAGKALDRLLELPDVHLTVTVGRDAELKAELLERTSAHSDRVEILGWTNQIPQLMMASHLIIGKAGGATVQEAIAARTPMIINQVIPGQEEGNAEMIEKFELGAGPREESCRVFGTFRTSHISVKLACPGHPGHSRRRLEGFLSYNSNRFYFLKTSSGRSSIPRDRIHTPPQFQAEFFSNLRGRVTRNEKRGRKGVGSEYR